MGARHEGYLMGVGGAWMVGRTNLAGAPQSPQPRRKCAVMEGMRPGVNQDQEETHIPHPSPWKEGFREVFWESKKLIPSRSLCSFGQDHKSQKETFELAPGGTERSWPIRQRRYSRWKELREQRLGPVRTLGGSSRPCDVFELGRGGRE